MKTIILIENGVTQLVLTPETDWEETICKRFTDQCCKASVWVNRYYKCAGGWTREGGETDSVIIKIEPLPIIKETIT